MTVKQARAIGYKIRAREFEKQRTFLIERGKLEEFKNSKYKYMINYIKFQLRLYSEYISYTNNN